MSETSEGSQNQGCEMFGSGLLILTLPVTRITSIPRILTCAADHVRDILYIHLAPGWSDVTTQVPHLTPTVGVKQLINTFYSCAASHHKDLDVRVIVGNIGQLPNRPRPTVEKYNLRHPYEVVLSNTENRSLLDYAARYFHAASTESQLTCIQVDSSESDNTDARPEPDGELDTYDNVCMGGTFDHIHTGHKILFNEALLVCDQRLVVGITDGLMNQKKTVCELMSPCEARVASVLDYLEDVKPQIQYSVVPISDPFGPSIVEPDLQCIVVSEETARGGNAVNTKRAEKGMSDLAMVTIPLVADDNRHQGEEEKISSSSLRKRKLGTLLRPVDRPRQAPGPYIIGLTGGIASGKSSVCKRLEGLGAAIIDCDKLGHEAYVVGGPAYQPVIDTFGRDILADDGTINRRALGPKVFADPELRHKLNEIVWPAIRQLAEDRIKEYRKQGQSVVILDAAVLLEAGWEQMADEVWTTIIPQPEAVKRIVERNNLPEEEALRRIGSQMSNVERVGRANVVLSTLWQPDITQTQVEKAWQLLQERLS